MEIQDMNMAMPQTFDHLAPPLPGVKSYDRLWERCIGPDRCLVQQRSSGPGVTVQVFLVGSLPFHDAAFCDGNLFFSMYCNPNMYLKCVEV